jgi:hypothetical protein
MNGLYSVVDGKIVLHAEAVQFLPTVSQLTEPEIRYLVAVYDLFDSPLKGQPLSLRRETAVSFFFPKADDKKAVIERLENDPEFKSAIQELQSITYDSDRTTFDTYNEKIYLLNQELKVAPVSSLGNILKSIDLFEDRAGKLKQKIEKDDVGRINIVLKGGKQLSFLENWQRTRETYIRTNGRTAN